MVGRALISLIAIAALSHCVSIDDRELEEHGAKHRGGSSNGGSSAGNTTSGTGGTADLPALCRRGDMDSDCAACSKAACCQEYQACSTNNDCQTFVSCGLACPDGDNACLDGCINSHLVGASLFTDYANCATDACGC